MSRDQAFEAVLDARTRALAAPPPGAEAVGVESLRLQVAGEVYTLALSAVVAAVALRQLTPLPHAPAAVAGLTSFRGAILPVFHLHVVLGCALAALPEHARIVIVGGAEPFALAVHAVESTVRVVLATLAPPPATLERARLLVRGVATDGVAHLDEIRLLTDPRLTVDIPLPSTR